MGFTPPTMKARGGDGSLRGVLSELHAIPPLGDWLLPPNANWQSSSNPGQLVKKWPSCLTFLGAVYQRTDLFNCKDMFGSAPGTPVQGWNCIYILLFHIPSLSAPALAPGTSCSLHV